MGEIIPLGISRGIYDLRACGTFVTRELVLPQTQMPAVPGTFLCDWVLDSIETRHPCVPNGMKMLEIYRPRLRLGDLLRRRPPQEWVRAGHGYHAELKDLFGLVERVGSFGSGWNREPIIAAGTLVVAGGEEALHIPALRRNEQNYWEVFALRVTDCPQRYGLLVRL